MNTFRIKLHTKLPSSWTGQPRLLHFAIQAGSKLVLNCVSLLMALISGDGPGSGFGRDTFIHLSNVRYKVFPT